LSRTFHILIKETILSVIWKKYISRPEMETRKIEKNPEGEIAKISDHPVPGY
jgi:hypothetical protein